MIHIPWQVEATWGLITPKNITHTSLIQRIVLCSFYYPGPKSKTKTILLDHICQAFQILSAKYGKGVHFLLCADANKLSLESILSLTPEMRQMVTCPTRLTPPEMLDPIITTLGRWYQVPVCLAPVEADPGTGGKTSDHLAPTMRPVDMVNNVPARTCRTVRVRPLPESRLAILEENLRAENWSCVLEARTADQKADFFHTVAMDIINKCVPEKIRKISNDDQDWYTEQLKNLDRKRRREFHMNRRSDRYLRLQDEYQKKCQEKVL